MFVSSADTTEQQLALKSKQDSLFYTQPSNQGEQLTGPDATSEDTFESQKYLPLYLSVDSSGGGLPPISSSMASANYSTAQFTEDKQKISAIMDQCHAQSGYADKPMVVTKQMIDKITEDEDNAYDAYEKL